MAHSVARRAAQARRLFVVLAPAAQAVRRVARAAQAHRSVAPVVPVADPVRPSVDLVVPAHRSVARAVPVVRHVVPVDLVGHRSVARAALVVPHVGPADPVHPSVVLAVDPVAALVGLGVVVLAAVRIADPALGLAVPRPLVGDGDLVVVGAQDGVVALVVRVALPRK